MQMKILRVNINILHFAVTLITLWNFYIQMPEIIGNPDLFVQDQHFTDVVMNNTIIVYTNHNWSQLKFLEAYYIKTITLID